MRVVGFVGLPGSGKSEAAAVAREIGRPVVTMGDVIRAEAADRGLEPTEAALGEVASELRERNGDAAVAERSLPLIREALDDDGPVVVDGIRGIAEVAVFEDAFDDGFVLVRIDAPFDTRLERVRDRGRDPTAEDRADLERRDERERGYGMEDAMAAADVAIENTDSLGAFQDRIRRLLREGPGGIASDDRVTVARNHE
jgi:dephospho-CoA kinase